MKTTCIIPFYNEGIRLIKVLNEVVKVKNIDQIICVDDHSDENHHNELQKQYPNVQFVRLSKNLGKAGAVRNGLKKAKGEIILMLDADLQNLRVNEIERAVHAFKNAQVIDMLVLRRINANLFEKSIRAEVLLAGERILWKKDLDKVLDGHCERWQLETAINKYMYLRKKKVFWVPQSAVSTYKPSKIGYLKGISYDLFISFPGFVSGSGAINLMKQIAFFAKDELEISDSNR